MRNVIKEIIQIHEVTRESNVSDFNAIRKWKSIPKDFRDKLVRNAFCISCGVCEMENDYAIQDKGRDGILLLGRCKNCRSKVTRFVEM